MPAALEAAHLCRTLMQPNERPQMSIHYSVAPDAIGDPGIVDA